ncbi:PadR family transcriptional regulator [Goodfellowiella coeruleoviolacea]|uniref:Transcriptional regulator, PadR family n=1 Tax=Goodfellowiella coeruleoviolacea TaxID=334858 RepID=A0AAE3GM04_9PSEU|nr:PadR family transcriptional regulator [Goodfellowiella coeruleoviolacea]MCP2169874.1 transcriptional regulator, PadR family [Goodfellowiella coeruleoviolacea]
MRAVLELAILGFLSGEPLHGYELRTRIAHLTGHVRPVSDGSLYPAIKRLEKAGLLSRSQEQGRAAAPRQVLSLTEAGHAELLRRLREPEPTDITDRNRFFTLLAFLHLLPDPADQAAVLRRRLAFITTPASFFRSGESGEHRVRAAEADTPFRAGMLTMARDITRAEQRWLRTTLATLDPDTPAE